MRPRLWAHPTIFESMNPVSALCSQSSAPADELYAAWPTPVSPVPIEAQGPAVRISRPRGAELRARRGAPIGGSAGRVSRRFAPRLLEAGCPGGMVRSRAVGVVAGRACRSDDTDARREARRCVGRSGRSRLIPLRRSSGRGPSRLLPGRAGQAANDLGPAKR
jgi:hypothetical protein